MRCVSQLADRDGPYKALIAAHSLSSITDCLFDPVGDLSASAYYDYAEKRKQNFFARLLFDIENSLFLLTRYISTTVPAPPGYRTK